MDKPAHRPELKQGSQIKFCGVNFNIVRIRNDGHCEIRSLDERKIETRISQALLIRKEVK